MREHATSTQAKRDIKTRQHLSERSFGQSTRYGYKRAPWRRLWRMQIQDFLICATQNIMVLIKESKERISKSNAQIGHIIGVQRATREAFSFLSLLIRILSQFTIGFAWKKGFVTPHGNIIFNASY
jgi:hypothetical protein